MWDVKITCIYTFVSDTTCFTLTMWDVKRVTMKLYDSNGNRFTLTMWDVKSSIILYPILKCLVLP